MVFGFCFTGLVPVWYESCPAVVHMVWPQTEGAFPFVTFFHFHSCLLLWRPCLVLAWSNLYFISFYFLFLNAKHSSCFKFQNFRQTRWPGSHCNVNFFHESKFRFELQCYINEKKNLTHVEHKHSVDIVLYTYRKVSKGESYINFSLFLKTPSFQQLYRYISWNTFQPITHYGKFIRKKMV